MFKNYFNDIAYIEVGPVIGLTIFFIFFVVLVYVVIKTDKGFISKMKNMPLNDDEIKNQSNKTSTQS